MKNHDFMSHELKLPELTLRGGYTWFIYNDSIYCI